MGAQYFKARHKMSKLTCQLCIIGTRMHRGPFRILKTANGMVMIYQNRNKSR